MYVIQTIAKQEYKVQTFLQSSGVMKDSESLWIPMKPKLMHSRNDVGGNQGSRENKNTKVWTEVKDILLPGYKSVLTFTPFIKKYGA